jgi:hypothetical protein
MLLIVLKSRDRETISGDLLEEYCDRRLHHVGAVQANYWYLRQLISLALVRIAGGLLVKQLLIVMCVFTILAGTWLGIMENILKHDGYEGRSVIAACIVLQGLATLLLFRLGGSVVFRVAVLSGTVGIVWLGISAIRNLAHTQHFEGFVFVIGLALIVQGALTLLTMLPLLLEPRRARSTS